MKKTVCFLCIGGLFLSTLAFAGRCGRCGCRCGYRGGMGAQRNSYYRGGMNSQSAGGQGINQRLRLRDGSCLYSGGSQQRQQILGGYGQGVGLQQRLRDGSCLNQTQ